MEKGFKWRGRWREYFGNNHPIVLELGCGKGEYTVAMAKKFSHQNFIGIDIKGARIWYGAREVAKKPFPMQLLRTQAELLDRCFAPKYREWILSLIRRSNISG
ncbi:MAG: methyltransferase domain-containing protein [Owenweeksia sp.]|nr:methyltransferase domain-containing protein [Owenweeksia sp.]